MLGVLESALYYIFPNITREIVPNNFCVFYQKGWGVEIRTFIFGDDHSNLKKKNSYLKTYYESPHNFFFHVKIF